MIGLSQMKGSSEYAAFKYCTTLYLTGHDYCSDFIESGRKGKSRNRMVYHLRNNFSTKQLRSQEGRAG